MEEEELKRKLLGLWEKTTHNSKEFLSVLFNYYFDIKYVEYKEAEGKVVSALCGMPYEFGYGNKRLKGLYIISLSSEEGFQKKGILADLLQTFNQKHAAEFDFTFIKPATELLADYYGTQGYFSSFYILEERFTPLHDFRKDYLLTLEDSDNHIKNLKTALLDEITVSDGSSLNIPVSEVIDFIRKIEKGSKSSVNLCHTEKDLEYIFDENSIRKLNYFVACGSDGKITGVAMTQKEEMKRTRVVANYVEDTCSYFALLEFIKRKYPDDSLSVNTSDPKYQMHSIIQQTYASSNPAGGDLDNTFATVEIPFNINKLLHPLGMVRLLRFDRLMTYIAETRSDVDFKLHIRDYIDSEGNNNVYVVKNGKCSVEPYTSAEKDKSILSLSIKDVSELLLRKNDSSNLIMEAFGLPRLNLQIRLLPV